MELQEFIEKSHIPKDLGGDDPWTYQYIEPISDENRLQLDDATKHQLLNERAALVEDFERTTQHWIRDSDSRSALQQKRTELTDRLRSSYWDIDPYLRARSLYDRTGLIQEGGRLQYYKSPAAMTPASQSGPLPAEHRADDLD